MPAPVHTLSVIIVALNEAVHLPGLKRAIDRLVRPDGCQLETIVVDGGSRDDTVDLAREAGFDRVEIVAGASIPTCRNHGAGLAAGTWLAYLDADCEPATDWLTQAAPWLSRDGDTVVGWPVEPPAPETWVQRTWHLHWIHKNPTWTECEGQPVITRQAFRLLTTRNLLMNRRVYDELNGFNPALLTGEDTDFVRRADAHGCRVIASPALRVVHHGEPAGLVEFFRQQRWHANRAAYRRLPRRGAGRRAVMFTDLYLATLALALICVLAGVLRLTPWPLLGTLPFCALLLAPALVVASRAGRLRTLPALVTLYGVYGLARGLDRLGLHRDKPSWRQAS